MSRNKESHHNRAISLQKLSKVMVFIITLLIGTTTFAGGIETLMKYASQDGTMANVNKGTIIKDQQGGYMTGGSVIVRGPAPKTLQPLLIQTPKFEYDACTGSADFRFGGLSFVSAKEFTDFFKNMGTVSASYAVKMLIKSACPQCEDIMSYLETVARDVNGLMLDQCASAQSIAQGAFSRITAGSQQKCMIQSNMSNANKDMYAATKSCNDNSDRFGEQGSDGELQSLLGNEFNLVWKALGKDNTGALDFKELIMSISGTIIGQKKGGRFEFKNKPSLVLSNDLLEQYIGIHKTGGKVRLYKCNDNNKCLDPIETEVALKDTETFYGNISRILTGMIPKIFKGKPSNGSVDFTDEEQAVIAFSSIPLVQLIEMEIIHKAKNIGGTDDINSDDMIVRMQEFLEVVCYDVVTNFLMRMANQASTAVTALEYVQVDDMVIKNFTSQVAEVRKFITDSKFAAFKRLQLIMQYKERLILQQRSFKAGFGRFLEYNTQQ